MRKAILTGPKCFEVARVPVPEIGPHDVLVKVLVSGVCASELDPWVGGGNYPLRLGHEVTGEVVEVGESVVRLRPGALVSGLFTEGFADMVVAHEDLVAELPEGVPVESALGEPIACVVSADLRTRIEVGSSVAIIGVGFMGLLMLELALARNPARVVAIDLRDDSLQTALHLGAALALRPDQVTDELRVPIRPRPVNGRGVDVVIEATGSQAGLDLATEIVREHGVVAILGFHQSQSGKRQVDMGLWNWKSFDVVNAHERRDTVKMRCLELGLQMVASRRLQLGGLLTHKFDLEQIAAAFAALEAKPHGFTKAVVVPS